MNITLDYEVEVNSQTTIYAGVLIYKLHLKQDVIFNLSVNT